MSKIRMENIHIDKQNIYRMGKTSPSVSDDFFILLCMNSFNEYTQGQLVKCSEILNSDLSFKEISDNFILCALKCFRIQWYEYSYFLGLESLAKDKKCEVYLSGLSYEAQQLFYKHIAYYLYRIERIDHGLLKEFFYTITDTLDELVTVLRQHISKQEIEKVILDTGELFKEMYESVAKFENSSGKDQQIFLNAYRENLSIKKSLFTDLKNIKTIVNHK